MKQSPCSIFAIIIGIFFLIEGIWGLDSPVVFGVLTTNFTHAVMHIVLGIVSIWLGWRNDAKGYCILLGILVLSVGVLVLVPGPDAFLISWLNINPAVAYVNIAIGVFAIAISAASRIIEKDKLLYKGETTTQSIHANRG